MLKLIKSCRPKHGKKQTTILMYPSDDKGKVTGRPKGMRSKLDTGAGTNIMSLSTYKSINPSDFDKEGIPLEISKGQALD